MMRALGAMPIMTALQIATASLAVPKSVMKTIAGRTVELSAFEEAPFGVDGGWAQPAENRIDRITTPRRTLERANFHSSPQKVTQQEPAQAHSIANSRKGQHPKLGKLDASRRMAGSLLGLQK